MKKTPPHALTLRLPVELYAEIKAAAEHAGHSINEEMVSRLSNPVGHTLLDIAKQNAKTQAMVQEIIDAITPRR